MPNVEDITAHLLEQDVVWVWGGSVAGLLAMWRLHGVDEAMRDGVGGRRRADRRLGGLDLLARRRHHRLLRPAAATDHQRARPAALVQRRPLRLRGAAPPALPLAGRRRDARRPGYATDDGAGLLYRGTEMVEAFAERDGAGAYFVERGPDGTAVETELPVTRLR